MQTTIDQSTLRRLSSRLLHDIAGIGSAPQDGASGLSDAYSHLRENDVLIVWKLDRLGRNVKGVVEFVCDLEQKGVHFQSLTDNINTTTAAGRFFFPFDLVGQILGRVVAGLLDLSVPLFAQS